ncbi:hypothetical protein KGQ34_00180 [Patescibacteria group bacterium]|nr:hypothetical protein [Patescibacteria group bacterium]
MKKKIASIIFGFIMIAAIGGLVLWQKNSTSEPPAPVVSSASFGAKETNNKEIQKTANAFTLAQVAEHNSRMSCWSAINGGVYDLTSWIPNHPGGEQAILQLCGVDGSEQYNSKHGNARKPATILWGFKIGTLTR